MGEPQFFETRMGRKFYEADVPKLIKVLERIADALDRVTTEKDKGISVENRK